MRANELLIEFVSIMQQKYPEPPVRKGEIRYPNLLSHIDAVKSRGIPGEMEVLIAVLRYGFAMRDRKHVSEKMINTITK